MHLIESFFTIYIPAFDHSCGLCKLVIDSFTGIVDIVAIVLGVGD
jgi:hypothetical protein